MVENTVGKGEIAHYQEFLLPQCFHKTFTAHMQKQGLVWERVKPHLFLALRFRSLKFCHMVKGMYAIYNGLSYRSSKDSK